jgi:hypothetical protein
MAQRTRRIVDYSDRTVRLTDERLLHIREHPEMVGQERRIREVLQKPILSIPVTKMVQSMYTIAIMPVVRSGQSI